MNNMDTLIAVAALLGAALAIVLWARFIAKTPARATIGDTGETPTADGEPRIVEEPIQYLVMLPSQFPAHLSALSIVPMRACESRQQRVSLRDYWRAQR